MIYLFKIISISIGSIWDTLFPPKKYWSYFKKGIVPMGMGREILMDFRYCHINKIMQKQKSVIGDVRWENCHITEDLSIEARRIEGEQRHITRKLEIDKLLNEI